MKSKDDPSTPSTAYSKMSDSWHKIRTVLGGTDAMRAAGERYLPRHTAENRKNWNIRIRTAILYNRTAKILDSWVGRPFSSEITIGDDVPEEVAELLKDVDLQGNNITVFSREWFREGLAKAFCHVLIDSPIDRTEGRTLDDDRREGARPFWSLIRPENLIAATSTVINGRERLTHARILEETTVLEGYEEKTIRRIREFNRYETIEGDSPVVTVRIWREPDKMNKDWTQEGQDRTLGIDEIPIVTFYAARSGPFEGRPPIEDIVDLNIAHWQQKSDADNSTRVANFPILAATGLTQEESRLIVVSPMKLLSAGNPSAKFFYVEHSGTALGVGRQSLLDLEEQMAEYGAEFLSRRPGTQTATARAIDSAESTASLSDAVIRFNDALEQAMYFTAKWRQLGEEDVGTLTVAESSEPLTLDTANMQALGQARARGDISRKRLLSEFVRRGVLAEDFDEEENESELSKEDDDMLTPRPMRGEVEPEKKDEEPEEEPEEK